MDAETPVSELVCLVYPEVGSGWHGQVFKRSELCELATPLWSGHNCVLAVLEIRVQAKYPGIDFERGVTGACDNCAEWHYSGESQCRVCGEQVEDFREWRQEMESAA